MGCPKRHVSVAMEPIVWQLYDKYMNENIRISILWQHLDTMKLIHSSSMFNSILQLLLRIYLALFYVYKYLASMFICVTWVPATAEVRRQHQIPQIAFTEVLSHVTIVPESRSFAEQQIPFTPDLHLLPLNVIFKLFLQSILSFPTINVTNFPSS